jgi:hypothetical protein
VDRSLFEAARRLLRRGERRYWPSTTRLSFVGGLAIAVCGPTGSVFLIQAMSRALTLSERIAAMLCGVLIVCIGAGVVYASRNSRVPHWVEARRERVERAVERARNAPRDSGGLYDRWLDG